jgi:hypothetical protein
MTIKTEFSDLIRAMARRDWGTADQIVAGLEKSGWDSGPQMLGAAFAIAVNERFPDGASAQEVADLVAATRAQFKDGHTFPGLQMEGIIRAALGEAELVDGIDAETMLEVQLLMIGKLLRDLDLDERQLEEFIAEVEETAQRFM